MAWPASVNIVDVTPRDGLQDEPTEISTEHKIALIRGLREAGIRRVEATSFVSPKWVPQLRDAEQVLAGLTGYEQLIALIPNRRGFDRAITTHVGELGFVVSASPRHQKDNLNMSLQESIEQFAALAALPDARRVRLRVGISCAFGSPFETEHISPQEVARIAKELTDYGAQEVTLADTVGVATPVVITQVITAVQAAVPSTPLALHLHDRFGLGLGNVVAALLCGVDTFESALGGLGGCPYAPNAPGNLNTEDLVRWLHHMHIETGVNPGALSTLRHTLLKQLHESTREGVSS